MSNQEILILTPKQKELIPIYREKWEKIAFSPKTMDEEKTIQTVKETYNLMGFNQPEIIIQDSPYQALKTIAYQLQNRLGRGLKKELEDNLLDNLARKKSGILNKSLSESLDREIRHEFYIQILDDIERPLWNLIDEELPKELGEQLWKELTKILVAEWEADPMTELHPLVKYLYNCFSCLMWIDVCSYFDFLFYIFELKEPLKEWELLQSLITNCGWIMAYENICLICKYPTSFCLDNERNLHAMAKPAIEFEDGFSIYANHGIVIPEKYGKLHPSKWSPNWLLEEENAQVKQALIKEIGYETICSELGTVKIDSWQGYELLKIDRDLDIEPIHLLKMTCPSTGNIYTLRIPPTIFNAKEGVKWINWGIDYEDFVVQT